MFNNADIFDQNIIKMAVKTQALFQVKGEIQGIFISQYNIAKYVYLSKDYDNKFRIHLKYNFV